MWPRGAQPPSRLYTARVAPPCPAPCRGSGHARHCRHCYRRVGLAVLAWLPQPTSRRRRRGCGLQPPRACTMVAWLVQTLVLQPVGLFVRATIALVSLMRRGTTGGGAGAALGCSGCAQIVSQALCSMHGHGGGDGPRSIDSIYTVRYVLRVPRGTCAPSTRTCAPGTAHQDVTDVCVHVAPMATYILECTARARARADTDTRAP